MSVHSLPSTNVPFVEPRSRILTPRGVAVTSTCAEADLLIVENERALRGATDDARLDRNRERPHCAPVQALERAPENADVLPRGNRRAHDKSHGTSLVLGPPAAQSRETSDASVPRLSRARSPNQQHVATWLARSAIRRLDPSSNSHEEGFRRGDPPRNTLHVRGDGSPRLRPRRSRRTRVLQTERYLRGLCWGAAERSPRIIRESSRMRNP